MQDAIAIGDNMIAFQRVSGGWSKSIKPDQTYSSEKIKDILIEEHKYTNKFDTEAENEYSHRSSTLDNGTTHRHLRYLLRLAEATKNKKYLEAVLKAMDYLLAAQYDSGGWPQNYPNTSGYGGHVTFNDGAMVGAMKALQEIGSGDYSIIGSERRSKANIAFNKGVEFILRSQIIVKGQKTAWCAQHDKKTYAPVGGRIYELPSVSGAESVGIVNLLMSIDNPGMEVKTAIVNAIKWFENVKILDSILKKENNPFYARSFEMLIKENLNDTEYRTLKFEGKGYDLLVEKKVGAEPMWARFYDIDTQKPLFSGWDGIKKYSLSEIDYQRRVGYAWLGFWPKGLLSYSWPKWKKRWLKEPDLPLDAMKPPSRPISLKLGE